MAALLALTSSLFWGTADFLGGKLSRRAAPLAVVGGSQVIAFVALVPVVTLLGAWSDPSGYLPWGIAAGVVGLSALVAFYSALAIGTMGVIAPIAATGVVVPVGIGLIAGERPAVITYLGIVAAILGVVLASGPEVRGVEHGQARGGWPALLLALAAAVGFGLVLFLVAEGAEYSVGMTLLSQRATNTVIVLLLLAIARTAGRLTRRDLPLLAVIGILDVSANATFALSSTTGLLVVVSVLGSLYPVVTVLLARVLLGERLQRLQQVGVAITLTGVALISAGLA